MPKQQFEDDTWLEPKLREANPFPASSDHDLDERALADLAMILGTGYETAEVPGHGTDDEESIRMVEANPATDNVVPLKRKPFAVTRRWVLGGLAAAAAAILVAVPLGSSLDGSTKATAAPMPPKAIAPSTVSTKDAVETLIKVVEAHPDPADFDPGRIDVGHWEGGAYGDGGVFDDRLSIPTINETHKNPDGSATIKQTVGEPFSPNGESIKYNRKNLMEKPGTVIMHEFGPGEFNSMFDTKLGRTAEDLYQSINAQLRPDSAAVNDGPQGFLQIMGFIMTDGKLDQVQSASLLGALPKIEGLKVMGTTTDRWNRDAVVFGVETPNEGGIFRTMLMFNPESGRLTNYMEEFLIDDDPATRGDFDTNMVTRYVAVSE